MSARRWIALLQLLAALFVWGAPARRAAAQGATTEPAPAAEADKLAEAKRHFQLGLNHLRDPEGERIESAFLEFRRAYELSSSARVLGNIGYCAMKLERYTEAVSAYREYLANVPNIDAVERQQIDQDLMMMTDGASTMVASYSAEGEWTLVDERMPVQGPSIKNTYGPYRSETSLLVHPGHHMVHLYVNGEEQGNWEFNATSGRSESHVFDPRPVEPVAPPVAVTPVAPQVLTPMHEAAPPKSYLAPLVTMGAGAALLVGGGVTGVLALGKMKDLEKQCPHDQCMDSGYKKKVDSARTLGTVTDALLISGGVVAAGGIIWMLVTRSGNRERAEREKRTVTAACGQSGCGIAVRGEF